MTAPIPAVNESPPPIAHERVLVVFSGLLLVLLLAALDSTIVATALPTIVGELGGLAHLSWVVTAYLLAQTIATPLYGKLGDLYGRKGVLQTAILLFLAAWGWAAPQVHTSLGAIPGPAQVWEQATNLYADHKAERAKEAAFYERQEKRNAGDISGRA